MQSMRRRMIGWLVPAYLLASTFQIMLPLIAIKAMAAAMDPLNHAEICQVAPSDSTTGGDTGNAPQAPHHCFCPICQVISSAPFALVADTIELRMPAQFAGPVLRDPAQSAGPRGPPFHKPRARSPPSFA